jgi:hypothetical protein
MRANFYKVLIALLLGSWIVSANAIDGSDISIMVLQDDSTDGGPTCMGNNSKQGKLVASKIGEQFRRYGYVVVPREALAAELGLDLNQPLDRTAHMTIMKNAKAKANKKPEFDIKALISYRLDCVVKKDSIAWQLEVSLGGNIYDTEAKRELGDFGPVEFDFAIEKNSSDAKAQMELASHASDFATKIADEARNKLALITKKAKSDGSSGRVVTYAVRLENLNKNANRIRTTMEKQFPGSMGITSLKTSGNLVTFGYKSSASSDKIQDWLQVVVDDLGMQNVALEIDGTSVRIRNDGDDLPAAKKPVERIFE